MLVLSRKPGEKIVVGNGITITLVALTGNQVRLGIEAPDQVRILRAELLDCSHEPEDSNAPPETAFPGEKAVQLPR